MTDWGHFRLTFTAPDRWTKLSFRLSKLAQPDWAKKVDATLQDATHVTFGAVEGDQDFDLWVDDIRFVKSPAAACFGRAH